MGERITKSDLAARVAEHFTLPQAQPAHRRGDPGPRLRDDGVSRREAAGVVMARRIAAALRRMEDHWSGDLVGVLALFGGGWLMLTAALLLDGGR